MKSILNNIKSADKKELFLNIKKQLDKDALLYLILIFIGFGYGFSQFIIPAFNDIISISAKLSEKKTVVKMMQQRLDNKNTRKIIKKDLPIKIFKPPYKGVELENSAVDFVEEILDLIKITGNNRISQLSYSTDKAKDNLGIVAENYEILRLNINLITSYEALQYFLNEIYLHEYLVIIKNVSITSMKDTDYNLINAYLILDLLINNE